MRFQYAQPFSFTITTRPKLAVVDIKAGVTEVMLSDGRTARATLQISDVKANPKKPGDVDLSCKVVAEVVAIPDSPIMSAHPTLQ